MNGDALIDALDLPAGSRVDQRVPKKLLLEYGAPTAADKRLINDGVEQLFWLAALKPTTIGVPEYRDDVRAYPEIVVLRVGLRPEAKVARLVELMHRAVPYPLLLLAEHRGCLDLSVAHKRWSQTEGGKVVVDGDIVAVEWDTVSDSRYSASFRDALALGRQAHGTLYTLYQSWIDKVLALLAARWTGALTAPNSTEHATARRHALHECARLQGEIARLRGAAVKEKQLARQMALNLELKLLEAAQAAAVAKL